LEIRIGTSGWHYAHWRGLFYPHELATRDWLSYYGRHFDSVEINGSFCRLPKHETFAAWRDGTPKDFVFAVKASRLITHMKKLKEAGPALESFLAAAGELKEKFGPLLFQLPPHWRCNPERLAGFLDILPKGLQSAFEFRDPSWHCEEIYALLKQHGAGICIYDLAGFQSPRVVTTDFTYIRLHGPGEAYSGRYTGKALAGWADWLRTRTGLRAAYVYFDNDQSAHAVTNAQELKALLQ
jgi:uncharacterized protein YecE (DUF72 family)